MWRDAFEWSGDQVVGVGATTTAGFFFFAAALRFVGGGITGAVVVFSKKAPTMASEKFRTPDANRMLTVPRSDLMISPEPSSSSFLCTT